MTLLERGVEVKLIRAYGYASANTKKHLTVWTTRELTQLGRITIHGKDIAGP